MNGPDLFGGLSDALVIVPANGSRVRLFPLISDTHPPAPTHRDGGRSGTGAGGSDARMDAAMRGLTPSAASVIRTGSGQVATVVVYGSLKWNRQFSGISGARALPDNSRRGLCVWVAWP